MAEIVGAEGEATYDVDRKVIDLGNIAISAEDMGVPFFLNVLSACIAKKVSQILGIDSGVINCRLKAYTDLDKIVEGREEIEYFTVELSLPGSWTKEEIINAVSKCPIASLLWDRIKDIKITTRPVT